MSDILARSIENEEAIQCTCVVDKALKQFKHIT